MKQSKWKNASLTIDGTRGVLTVTSVSTKFLRAIQLVCVRWSTRTDLPPSHPAPGGKPDHTTFSGKSSGPHQLSPLQRPVVTQPNT